MNATVRLVGEEHQRRSPGCPAKELSELMIPMSGLSAVIIARLEFRIDGRKIVA